ncbi:spore coat U domain-containing protein [Paucibacter sp. O1-1]|uniref:Csu type fimbrial protein n=1 Tax=unclassified Roseateles TaxID=2626991 RepID=UPI0014853A0B|nr:MULTISPECIES: spore coat U domain-containing protein [unclassified Roseateles]MCU7373423.1 spore coat U domain-containing protein [Paucibacter sp. O1-1]MCZ7879716.1 spore coat U domain-containing protein [Paucibacter sp. M5-1]MDA3828423.1 spore coat U domain-containing protein [Paucibacter sp. O1-1]MDC6167209.1 spore coat U domain-containing protein [Paucibacter sp. XJ19-41]
MRLLRLLVLLLAAACGAGSAQALCLPVLCSCTVSTTPLLFGSYNPLAHGHTDSSASIKVGCGGVAGLLIPYNLAISAGGGGSFANRRMSLGAHQLSYNLYTDAARSTVWGDGTAATLLMPGSITLDILGLAPQQTHWVYGRLPGRQLGAAPGAYTDTLSVTLTYY